VQTFSELGLDATLLKALAAEGYETPTPIQAQAIPPVLAGKDLLGIAQTGTGKTAAFALPILHRLKASGARVERRTPRVLVLAPTRELANQIADSFRVYGKNMGVTVAVFVGGVKYGAQIKALAPGVDVLVATPGRLLDHMSQGTVKLDTTSVLVLDEADQMLDLGFLEPIKKIVRKLPPLRQNLFFSATMPKAIAELAGDILRNPQEVSVTPQATTVEKITQKVLHIEQGAKRDLLVELLAQREVKRAIVFTRTKHGADKLVQYLEKAGLDAAAIHGNKSQGQRERALAAFKKGQVQSLVATDIAARGIDVDDITHVFQFELPNVPESYVHRIGRTARAGAEGAAVALVDTTERGLLRDIEKLTGQAIPSEDRRVDQSRPLPEGRPEPQRAAKQAQRKRSRARPADRAPRDGGEARGASFGHRTAAASPRADAAPRAGFGQRPQAEKPSGGFGQRPTPSKANGYGRETSAKRSDWSPVDTAGEARPQRVR
jgi:ATP-dependent RNA helicase RhlE